MNRIAPYRTGYPSHPAMHRRRGEKDRPAVELRGQDRRSGCRKQRYRSSVKLRRGARAIDAPVTTGVWWKGETSCYRSDSPTAVATSGGSRNTGGAATGSVRTHSFVGTVVTEGSR